MTQVKRIFAEAAVCVSSLVAVGTQTSCVSQVRVAKVKEVDMKAQEKAAYCQAAFSREVAAIEKERGTSPMETEQQIDMRAWAEAKRETCLSKAEVQQLEKREELSPIPAPFRWIKQMLEF